MTDREGEARQRQRSAGECRAGGRRQVEGWPGHLAAVIGALREAGCVRAEDEAALLGDAADSAAELADLVRRRVGGEPLEHVLGWAEFAGVRVAVAPGVFVPRRRSEHLVDVAAALLVARGAGPVGGIAPPLRQAGRDRSASPGRVEPRTRSDSLDPPSPAPAHATAPASPIVVDVCAGSGALGVALHQVAGPFTLWAVDIDPAAVACATANLAPMGGLAVLGDLFDAVPDELRHRIDLVLANAPYVPTGEIALLPHEAREHETLVALDGGADGLAVHRRLLSQAADWLAPGGSVLVELSPAQVPAVRVHLAGKQLVADEHPAPEDPDTVVVVGTRPL